MKHVSVSMDSIKIHALRCGQVRTTKYLAFNPDNKCIVKVAGVGVPPKDWGWLPVYCYYIEHPKGKFSSTRHGAAA